MRGNDWFKDMIQFLDAYVRCSNSSGEFCGSNGIIRLYDSVVLEFDDNWCVVADSQSHKLIRVNDTDLSQVQHNQVLDLSNDGERWEGDVLDNMECGWGVAYDKDNRIAYEGFRIGAINSCYGTQYYPDLGVIEYRGNYCKGKRWGIGVLYDRKENVLFDGEWVDGVHLERKATIERANLLYHNRIEELTIQSESLDHVWKNLDFSFFPNLRRLKVCDNAFLDIEDVNIIGMTKLKSVWIGNHCFTGPEGKFSGCHFSVKDCPRLKTIKVGIDSMQAYSHLELTNLPSLKSITVGDLNALSNCFVYANLKLKGNRWKKRVMHRSSKAAIHCDWKWLLYVYFSFSP